MPGNMDNIAKLGLVLSPESLKAKPKAAIKHIGATINGIIMANTMNIFCFITLLSRF